MDIDKCVGASTTTLVPSKIADSDLMPTSLTNLSQASNTVASITSLSVTDSLPQPLPVGREFVRQFYNIMGKSPKDLYRFYSANSTLTFGNNPILIGQDKIRKDIERRGLRNCHAYIIKIDSQPTLGNGIVVQVIGELSNNGEPMRPFTQTFVLSPLVPKNYYVYNEIFRYQDEVYREINLEVLRLPVADNQLTTTTIADQIMPRVPDSCIAPPSEMTVPVALTRISSVGQIENGQQPAVVFLTQQNKPKASYVSVSIKTPCMVEVREENFPIEKAVEKMQITPLPEIIQIAKEPEISIYKAEPTAIHEQPTKVNAAINLNSTPKLNPTLIPHRNPNSNFTLSPTPTPTLNVNVNVNTTANVNPTPNVSSTSNVNPIPNAKLAPNAKTTANAKVTPNSKLTANANTIPIPIQKASANPTPNANLTPNTNLTPNENSTPTQNASPTPTPTPTPNANPTPTPTPNANPTPTQNTNPTPNANPTPSLTPNHPIEKEEETKAKETSKTQESDNVPSLPLTYANVFKSSNADQSPCVLNLDAKSIFIRSAIFTSSTSSLVDSQSTVDSPNPNPNAKLTKKSSTSIKNSSAMELGTGRTDLTKAVNSACFQQEKRSRNRRERYGEGLQLFLGNLPTGATGEALTNMFKKYGKILELRVLTKPVKPGAKKAPNYGFLTYETRASVQRCLAAAPFFFPENARPNVRLNVRPKNIDEDPSAARLNKTLPLKENNEICEERRSNKQRRAQNSQAPAENAKVEVAATGEATCANICANIRDEGCSLQTEDWPQLCSPQSNGAGSSVATHRRKKVSK